MAIGSFPAIVCGWVVVIVLALIFIAMRELKSKFLVRRLRKPHCINENPERVWPGGFKDYQVVYVGPKSKQAWIKPVDPKTVPKGCVPIRFTDNKRLKVYVVPSDHCVGERYIFQRKKN